MKKVLCTMCERSLQVFGGPESKKGEKMSLMCVVHFCARPTMKTKHL